MISSSECSRRWREPWVLATSELGVGVMFPSLSEQLFVPIMGADPKPDQAFGPIPCQRAYAKTNPSGPEIADFLES